MKITLASIAGLALTFAGAVMANDSPARKDDRLEFAKSIKQHMRDVVREASSTVNIQSQTDAIVYAYNTYKANWVAVSGMKFQPVLATHNGGAAAVANCTNNLNHNIGSVAGRATVTNETGLLDAASACLRSLDDLRNNSGMALTPALLAVHEALGKQIDTYRISLNGPKQI